MTEADAQAVRDLYTSGASFGDVMRHVPTLLAEIDRLRSALQGIADYQQRLNSEQSLVEDSILADIMCARAREALGLEE